MPITALYASLLVPLYIFISARVIRFRRAEKISVGHAENNDMLKRMRVHGNFAEYAPLALILLGLAESLDAWRWFLHLCGLMLLVGRYAHAYGMSQPKQIMRLRVGGMGLTLTTLAVLALTCAGLAISGGKLI